MDEIVQQSIDELYPLNSKGKKESLTNSYYQSTFLPIFQRAETEIKKLIVSYFWLFKSKLELKTRIDGIIEAVDKKIPADLINRNSYINGLRVKAEKLLSKYYDYAIGTYFVVSSIILRGIDQRQRPPKITNPKELTEFIESGGIQKYDVKFDAKGSIRVNDYERKVKEFINNVSNQPFTTLESDGRKPISLWQKAELDIRHENQMEMLDKLIQDGVELCWISSHPDASERCEKWQGKLVSLTEHATMSGFRVRKVDGNWVYSLPDITAVKDKYGYTNNIIVGFNCFDKETEVLTNKGWKLFCDLDKTELIYTLDPKTKTTEWQKPTNYFKSFHDGKMIHFKSYISDLMTTPNHNILYYQQHDKTLRFREADKIVKTNIQYAGQEWNGNDQKTIKVGSVEVETKLFCKLLGYWLADGSIHSDTAIKISQMNNNEMWDSLQGLPFNLWRDNNKIIIRNKDLVDMLKPLGKCNTKYIFNWVKELSTDYLKELLEAYNYTDGYKTKTKTINGYERKPHKTLFTSSEKMSADLCEIALKCGYRPKIELRKQKGTTQKFKNGVYTMNYDLYIIHLNYNTSFRFKTIEKVDYNDYVYCVEVPNHTLLVKRNGFIQWCGNCRHHLIPYTQGSVAPKSFSKVDIKKEREINSNLRTMEREIRIMKTRAELYKGVNNRLAKNFEKQAKIMTDRYKQYAEHNGFAWYQYRIEV